MDFVILVWIKHLVHYTTDLFTLVQYCSFAACIVNLSTCLGFGGSCHDEDVPSANNQIMQGLYSASLTKSIEKMCRYRAALFICM